MLDLKARPQFFPDATCDVKSETRRGFQWDTRSEVQTPSCYRLEYGSGSDQTNSRQHVPFDEAKKAVVNDLVTIPHAQIPCMKK